MTALLQFMKNHALNHQGYKHIESVTHLNPRTIFIAILLFVGGGYLFIFSAAESNHFLLSVSALLLLSGIPFLVCIERISLSKESGIICIYKDYFVFRVGKEYDSTLYQCIAVFYDSSDLYRGKYEGADTHFYDSSARHYEVFLIGRGQKKVFVREYDQYKPAKKLCETLSAELKLNHKPQLIIGKNPEGYVCKEEG